jgi:hypothetical protein
LGLHGHLIGADFLDASLGSKASSGHLQLALGLHLRQSQFVLLVGLVL